MVILNALPSQRTIEKEARQAIEKIGGNVCEYTVGQRIIFSHAMTAGLGVVEFDVNSKASREIQNIFELINQVKKDAK